MRKIMLLATTALTALLHGQALAQDVPPTEQVAPVDPGEDIVVTGIRGSLDSAIEDKRQSDVIQDGISAEDIGLLPDVSISEALIRIPGVTSNSDLGESGQVAIRGLGPDLVLTTINGRLLTTADEANRRVTLQSLPSEGLSRAIVLKTPMAKTIEGGVAGTIELQTIRPLERNERVIAAVVRGTYDELSNTFRDAPHANGFGVRGEATYIDQFADGTLGVALVYAGLKDYAAASGVKGELYRLGTNPAGPNDRSDPNGDGAPDALPTTMGPLGQLREKERHSGILAVQWEPNDRFAFNLDANYSREHSENEVRRLFAQGLFNGDNGNLRDVTVVNDSVLAAEADAIIRGVINFNDVVDETYGVGFNAAVIDGPWTARLDVSYSRSRRDRDNPITPFESDGNNAAMARRVFAYDITDRENPFVTFAPSAADAADYNLATYDFVKQDSDDRSFAVRTDFEYALDTGFLRSIDFGMRYDRRHHERIFDRSLYSFANQAARPDLDDSFVLVGNPFANQADDFGGPNAVGFPFFDQAKLIALALGAPGVRFDDTVNQDLGTSHDVEENTFAGYVQANIDTMVFGRSLRGNLGVRYFNTSSRSIGNRSTVVVIANPDGTFDVDADSTVTVPVTENNEYGEFLPALNLNYNVAEDLFVRFAATRAISRPLFTELSSGIGVEDANDVDRIRIDVGNAQLEPFTSDQLDLSLEWYPSRSTAFSIAGYYKWVSNFTTTQQIPGTILTSNGVLAPTLQVTTINDPEKRYFRGFEVSARTDFTFLPGFLRNLGVSANYNYNETDAVEDYTGLVGSPPNPPFPSLELAPNNISKHVVNAILFYEAGPLSLRAAYRYYSDYNRRIFQSAQTLPSGQLDLSGGFDIAPGIRLVGNVVNVFDKKIVRYAFDSRDLGNMRFLENSARFGRNYTFGIRARF